jgi:hypothetical protein
MQEQEQADPIVLAAEQVVIAAIRFMRLARTKKRMAKAGL